MRVVSQAEFVDMDEPSAAFTLIEIMMVIGILGMVLAMAMPSFVSALHKDPLRQAVSDIEDACGKARAAAILQGVPFELIIRAADGRLTVTPAHDDENNAAQAASENMEEPVAEDSTASVFSARLNDNVAISLLYVNLKDQMKSEETRVHFYPTGTSDEFTIILQNGRGTRKISLECVTGLANLEVIQ